jgi:hypothetical protein
MFGILRLVPEPLGHLFSNSIELGNSVDAPDDTGTKLEVQGWTKNVIRDAMTDNLVTTVSHEYSVSNYRIDVAVSCDGKTYPNYVVTAYDRQNRPAPLAWDYEKGYWTLGVHLRIDTADSVGLGGLKRRFSNQLSFTTANVANLRAADPVTARQLVVELPLADGNAVFTMKQDDPDFSSAVAPCVAAYTPKQTSQEPSVDNAASEPSVVEPSSSDVSRAEPSVPETTASNSEKNSNP